MTPEKILQLNTLLLEHTFEVGNDPPHDYSSLKEQILLLELSQELEKLWELRADIDHFEDRFRERCGIRVNHEEGFSFYELPGSITNELYWKIALLLFNPKTMGEMIRILVPSVKSHLQVGLPDKFLEGQTAKEAAKNLEPTLVLIKNLDSLKMPPHFSTFMHYVIVDNVVFNLEDIADFSLQLHSRLHTQLTQRFPMLAEKMYAHAPSMQMLADDCQMLKNKGTAPKVVLEQLIHGLQLGGEYLSGIDEAQPVSYRTLMRFIDYFNALPQESQTHLRKLEHDRTTLGSVIDQIVKEGRCVQETAKDVIRIINRHPDDKILNNPPVMTAVEVKKMENNYKKSLDILRDQTLLPRFPTTLTNACVRLISPTSEENWLDLIIKFPMNLYDLLLESVHLKEPKKNLKNLAKLVKLGFFNNEQKVSIAKAIAKHYARFHLKENAVSWSIHTNNQLTLSTILSTYEPNKRLAALKAIFKRHYMNLSVLTEDIELFNAALALLPQKDRLQALQTSDEDQNPILFRLAERNNVELLKETFALLTEPQRINALIYSDKDGNTLLHHCANEITSLKGVLSLYLPFQVLAAISQQNNEGETVLHKARTVEALKLLLELYPDDSKRMQVFSMVGPDGDTFLHQQTDYSFFLKMALDSLSVPNRLKMIMLENKARLTLLDRCNTVNSIVVIVESFPSTLRENILRATNSDSVLSRVIQHPDSLKTLLLLLPETDRCTAMKVKIGNVPLLKIALKHQESFLTMLELIPATERVEIIRIALEHATKDPEALKFIISHIPAPNRLEIFKQVAEGPCYGFLDLVIKHPACLAIVLESLQEKEIIELVKGRPKDKETILERCYEDYAALQMILNVIPESQRFAICKTCGADGVTVLHRATRHSHPAIDIILKSLPESQRLELITMADEYGKTPLYRMLDYHDIFLKVLTSVPENHRLAALKIGFYEKDELLHRIKDKELLIKVIELLPEMQRIEAYKWQNKKGMTLLHRISSKKVEAFSELLELLPESKRVEAAMIRSKDGLPLLHSVAKKSLPLRILISAIPENKRFLAIKTPDDLGENVLDCCNHLAMHIKILLDSLPERHRLEALILPDEDGATLLHKFCDVPEELGMILSTLPKSQILDIVMKPLDAQHQSVLTLCVKHQLKSIILILSLLPEDQKLTLLRTEVEGASILNHLLKAPLSIYSLLNTVNNSFVAIFAFLNEQATLTPKSHALFGNIKGGGTEAQKLLHEICQLRTLPEIKNHLTDYTLKNPNSPLTSELGKLLAPTPAPSARGLFRS